VQHIAQGAFPEASGARHADGRRSRNCCRGRRASFFLVRSQRTPVVLSASKDMQESVTPGLFEYRASTDLLPDLEPLAA
jgi:hypothetical protein